MTRPARTASTRAHAAPESRPSPIELISAAADAASTVPHDVTFAVYAESFWLPHHVIEAVTRQTYVYVLRRHLIPTFGGMQLPAITPSDVRTWVSSQQAKGVKPATLLHNKTVLSAIFTTAFNDQLIQIHPCRGVKTPPVPRKPRRAISPEQFDAIYQNMRDPVMQLLVETDIETGLRWGELTELRAGDLDITTRMLTVSRAVVELIPRFHPTGGRFLVKDYPKDKEYRRLKLSPHITDRLANHIGEHALAAHDLIFSTSCHPTHLGRPRRPDPSTLGLTEPDRNGYRRWHGTTSGYAGGCRCSHCRGLPSCAPRPRERPPPHTPASRRRRAPVG